MKAERIHRTHGHFGNDVEDLRTLTPPKLAEAATLIHGLKETSRAERPAAMKRSAGILTDEEGAELERVIEEGCEKIDPRDR